MFLCVFIFFFSLLCPTVLADGPKVVTPTSSSARQPKTQNAVPPDPRQRIVYPWHKHITATIFWIGEQPTAKNPTPNAASSWDRKWMKNYGGYDTPDINARVHFRPKAFLPKQNPFYVALPYNDCLNYRTHKPEAPKVIPWWSRARPVAGKTTCKGRWVQIIYGKRSCFAQWEDCGPFVTDDWRYVFGNARPKNQENKGAGIDVSPAVRDYLGLKSGAKVHWRFVDFYRVPRQGPWTVYGKNNPFRDPKQDPDFMANQRYMDYLRKIRDQNRRR